MNWRRIQVLLCIAIAVIAVLRFLSGNIIGGLVSAAIAVVLFSWTTKYPLVSRIRRAWRLLTFGWRKRPKDD